MDEVKTGTLVEEKPKPEGLKPAEIAALMGEGWDAKKVRRAIRSGKLHSTKVEGRWYVTEAQVDEYLELIAKEAAEKELAAQAAAEAEAKATAEKAASNKTD